MPTPLRVLLAVALLEVVVWSFATPPLIGPDESAHFAYAQYLAETGDKPQYDRGSGTISTEAGSAMYSLNLWATVGAGAGRPFWSDPDLRGWRDFESRLSGDFRGNAGGPNAVAKNPPLYYAYQAVPYRMARDARVLDRVFLMRLANAVPFLVAIVLTWLIAAELFTSALARTVAAAAVALHPVAAYMTGVVNPDNMLLAWWAAFLLAALRLLLRGPSAKRVLVLVLITALALATHGRALPLALTLPVALLLTWWRHRPPIPRAVRLGAAAFAVVLVAGLVAGGSGLYGGELRVGQFGLGQFLSFVWQFYLPPLPFMDGRVGPAYGFRQVFVEQYLATWGALDVRLERDTYRVLQIVVAGGLVALAAAAVRLRAGLRERWDVVALLAALVFMAVLFLHLVSYRAVVGGGMDPLIVGRYLIPLTPVAGLAVALVVRAAGRRAPYAAAVVLALLVLLQLGGLGASLTRFYA